MSLNGQTSGCRSSQPPAPTSGPFDEAGSGTGKSKLPWGIASDPTTGNLYVTEVGNNRVQEFSPSGSFIAAFGSAGSGAGQLSAPKGVAVGSTGHHLRSPTPPTTASRNGQRESAGEPPTYATSFTPPTTSKEAFKEPERGGARPEREHLGRGLRP